MSDTKLKFLIYDETMSGNAKCQHQELQWLNMAEWHNKIKTTSKPGHDSASAFYLGQRT